MFQAQKRSPWRLCLLVAVGAGAALLAACQREEPVVEAPWAPPQIKGYQEMTIPPDNPMTRAKVELGHKLYYDQRLSGDESRSCYSCHLKEHGLTDGRPKAVGAYEVNLPRKSPTMWNIGYHQEFYWDGRAKSLEAQVKAAWTGGNMGVSGKDGRPSTADICAKLDKLEGYRREFQAVFGGACTEENVVKALAAFVRTIVANHENSAWIRFREGDEWALSEQARRGYKVFAEKAKCTNCHDGLLLTDLQYHNIGIGMKAKEPDLGRFNVTKVDKDRGAFKTPTLIDISKRAPYFHDGSVATLEEAVDLMLGGGLKNQWLDTVNLQPAKLTKEERDDLLVFLKELDAEYKIPTPQLPQ